MAIFGGMQSIAHYKEQKEEMQHNSGRVNTMRGKRVERGDRHAYLQVLNRRKTYVRIFFFWSGASH